MAILIRPFSESCHLLIKASVSERPISPLSPNPTRPLERTARIPLSAVASATLSIKKYISVKVVVPPLIISAIASIDAQ